MDILSLLKQLHSDLQEASQGWWRCNDGSKHRDKALCFNLESMSYNNFRSGESGSIYSYLKRQGFQIDYQEIWRAKVKRSLKPEKLKVDLPSGFKLLGDTSAYGEWALKYMTQDRGIEFEVLQDAFVGYDDDTSSKFFGCVVFPCLRAGEIVYFSGRNFLNTSKRHVNVKSEEFNIGSAEVIYNSDALYLHKKVYLAEGVVDALTCWPYGIATYKWKISPQQYRILASGHADIIIPYDRGFKKEAQNTALSLTKMGKRVKLLDLSDHCGKDINDWGFDLVQEVEEKTDWFSLKKMFAL